MPNESERSKKSLIRNPDNLHGFILDDWRNWKRYSQLLRGLFVLLACISVGFSVAVTSTINSWDPTIVAFMAAIAALSSACLTGLGITSKSNDMMNARRQLEGAIMDFEMGLISRKKLSEIHHQAAYLIGDVKYSAPDPAPPDGPPDDS